MRLRLFIAGQKAFGAAVFEMVRQSGHDVVGVSAPPLRGNGQLPDRLRAAAESAGVPWLVAGALEERTLPEGVDLILAAHSHDFIGRKTRLKARLGGIGYHPSLLPRHRGRDAVRWTIHMGDPVTGGTVYWLSDAMDGGDIAAQEHVFVRPDDTVQTLWRDRLSPLGVSLFGRVLADLSEGRVVRQKQDPAVATWEPSWGREPVRRPDLDLIGSMPAGFRVVSGDVA